MLVLIVAVSVISTVSLSSFDNEAFANKTYDLTHPLINFIWISKSSAPQINESYCVLDAANFMDKFNSNPFKVGSTEVNARFICTTDNQGASGKLLKVANYEPISDSFNLYVDHLRDVANNPVAELFGVTPDTRCYMQWDSVIDEGYRNVKWDCSESADTDRIYLSKNLSGEIFTIDNNGTQCNLEKPSFGPSKWLQKLKTAKNSKLPNLPKNYFEPIEKGGWPLISTVCLFHFV